MSRYSKYNSFDISTNATVFEFVSIGPKGEIKKIIQFSQTEARHIYNLAFGNMQIDGTIDDETTNDNKDRNKILATVAAAVFSFTDRYPDKYVFFTGSTLERNRLYRMALTINHEELIPVFEIWSLKTAGGFEIFQKNHSYTGFLIKRK
jgi:hypothetical protein